ncbi:MAG: arginine--tRNA ligase, partial [Actinobacteria bacterium]|nr:arginine--tRNA ligase [Actinomycetota bacterium]
MARERIIALIEDALSNAVERGLLPPVEVRRIELDRPKRREHGDWATNIALDLASRLGRDPKEIAEAIAGSLEAHPDVISSVEVAGRGFINFHLSASFIREVLLDIQRTGPEFGSSDAGGGEKVQVEFVSANPVGPLHVGHGRWAALGDTLAGVMSHAGYLVEREFYINDYGTQINNFGRSISARYMELSGGEFEFPEGGYAGQYIIDIARRIRDEHGDEFKDLPEERRVELFIEMEYPRMLESIERALTSMGVEFDVWFSERDLYGRGEVERTLSELESSGEAYRDEGALWLRTTRYG